MGITGHSENYKEEHTVVRVLVWHLNISADLNGAVSARSMI